ncbi:hypothetical protein [Natranaeroarchaeum aerophilus]|uniref:DUF1102 domain-containing protein n=1 Tax=Natranaeroarchaeum aerophilus TaxID=2917711 RepID=A0AAE3FS64_9EURY|nr:hypothetical protein [Natranaeroarchaeum aerophilus]MCL9813559.1 hypothetical protein [Natranaeroarchaeum aerophilus]
MKRRAFMGLGATSISVGALYGTGAFSSVNAGRGISVNAVDDSEALLKIDNIDSTDDPIFTNKTGLGMVVTLEEVDTTVTFNGESSPYTFPDDGTLDPDASRSVEIESDDDSEDVLVDVTAELYEDETKKGTIELRRDFSVPQSEIVNFTGRAKAPGGSGKFEFDIENTGTKNVTFTGVGINATTRDDADRVADKKNRDEGTSFVGDGQDLVTTSIPIDSSDPDTYTRRDFDSDLTLPEGEEFEFEFDRFRNEAGDQLKMEGENVRITLYFGDDSSKTINLCLDNATCGEY